VRQDNSSKRKAQIKVRLN